MSISVLVILGLGSLLVTITWARPNDYQPILTQISEENSECNELLGDFNLDTVPQFNALCNIPIPDHKQTEFLIENNVVPILCMGLMEVSLRMCKSAKNDINRFEDIFPPTSSKFNEIFLKLGTSNDFSSLDAFCSTTVKRFAINETTSNITKLWWQVLNKLLSDNENCTYICHSKDGHKVNPLCSYILWSNGVYINYQKYLADGKVATSGEVQERPTVPKFDEIAAANQAGNSIQNISIVTKEPVGLINPAPVVISADSVPSLDNKIEITEGSKSNFTTDNKIEGVGTVEQVVPIGDQTSNTNSIKTDINSSINEVKLSKKSKHHKIKQPATTLKPYRSESPKVEAANVQEKPVLPSGETEVKVQSTDSSTAVVPSEPQGDVQGSESIVPESVKPSEAKQGPDTGKEGMVEDDSNLEMAHDAVVQEQPIAPDNSFLSSLSDGEGEDGDGDDLDIIEPNVANNSSKPAGSQAIETSIQQGFQEGDKVYAEGEILIEDHFIEAEDSHFFTYFLCMAVLTIMAYLAFHNKKKLIALAVEGRRTKGGRRRPNSSHYSKLDCSLEEALVSNTTASVTHVLY